MAQIQGKRFGRLVAAMPTGRRNRDGTIYWTCWCDCGNCTAASYASLVEGAVTSCGCGRIIGRKSGWLTVENVLPGNRLLCRCACGTELTLQRRELEQVRSCGCEKKIRLRRELDGQVSLFPLKNGVPLEDSEDIK